MGLLDIIKGAGGGAATGGSLAGPWGAGIGAVAGGLLSGLSGDAQDSQNAQMDAYRRQILSRGIPQITGTATASGATGFRQNQTDLISRLDALSRGEGPSMAANAYNQAIDRNMAQQQSIAQSGRGNATLANIVAANNAGNFGQQAAAGLAQGRISEQQQALGQLGQTLGQSRAADDQLAMFNAQQQNYANKDNLEAKLRLMGLNDSSILNIMQQQGQAAQRPGLSDQLLAGGAGALGMWSANRGKTPGAQQMGGGGAGFGNLAALAGGAVGGAGSANPFGYNNYENTLRSNF